MTIIGFIVNERKYYFYVVRFFLNSQFIRRCELSRREEHAFRISRVIDLYI